MYYQLQHLYRSIKSNIKLFVSIILFTTYIALSGIYHGAPMHELDNYYRFLLLVPLVVITLNERHLITIICSCAIMALVFALYNNAFFSMIKLFIKLNPITLCG